MQAKRWGALFVGCMAGLFLGQALRADGQPVAELIQPGIYLGAQGEFRFLGAKDIAAYTGTSTLAPFEADNSLDLWLGMRIRPHWGMDLEIETGPYRAYALSGQSNSGDVLSASVTWSNLAFALCPSWRIAMQGFMNQPLDNVLGFKLGYANLSGQVSLNDLNTGQSGSYTQSASGLLFGLFYRAEQFMGENFTTHFTVGYTVTRFTPVSNTNGNGLLTGIGSPAQNTDGSNLAVDFSGFYIATGLSYWFGKPWQKPTPTPLPTPAAQPLPSPAAPPDLQSGLSAGESMALGKQALAEKRYQDALSAYLHAVNLEPDQASAWLGLGNAHYYLGHKPEAVAAFQRALELDPSNAKLKAFLEKYNK